jgi:hypothetical protein
MTNHDSNAAPRVWADGFGLWHAEVPATHPHLAAHARRLIRHEMTAHGEAKQGYRLNLDQREPYTPGMLHYKER